MRNRTAPLFIAGLTAVALLSTACGDDAAQSSPATRESSTTIDEPAPESISEQDIATARQVFDSNRALWTSREPFAYTMAIGVETVSELRISFDAEGNMLSEDIVRGDPGGRDTDSLPRSVNEVFTLVDGLILAFEDGTAAVPEEGECGRHFNVRFDGEFGVPSRYDSLGPCDDGVGVVIELSRN